MRDDSHAMLRSLRDKLECAGPPSSLRHAFETAQSPALGSDHRRHFHIDERGDALVEIPLTEFPRQTPHHYTDLGAPYPAYSPFHCRHGVLEQLRLAQQQLQRRQPGWSIQIFDAYRPLAVQRFMVDHEFQSLARLRGFDPDNLPGDLEETLWESVYSIWAKPDNDPRAPIPHCTGAALDVTLVDAEGIAMDAGSPIDAFGDMSRPDYFAHAHDPAGRRAHTGRTLLSEVMHSAGFQRHPFEWWHFSWGDQLWALMCWLDSPDTHHHAFYGAAG